MLLLYPCCGRERVRQGVGWSENEHSGKTGNRRGSSGQCAAIRRQFRTAWHNQWTQQPSNGGGRDATGRLFVLYSEFWQKYHRSYHTIASDLGALATEARPGLLVLYHGLFYGVPEAVVLDEVRTTYDGEVVLADDLDIF